MGRTAYEGGFAEILTVLAVTEGTYLDWPARNAARGAAPKTPIYRDWTAVHASPEFEKFVRGLFAALDELASPQSRRPAWRDSSRSRSATSSISSTWATQTHRPPARSETFSKPAGIRHSQRTRESISSRRGDSRIARPRPRGGPHGQFRARMILDRPCQGGLSLAYEHMYCPCSDGQPMFRASRKGACTRAGPPSTAVRRRASRKGACTRRSALHSATGHAPPVRERAPAPVRPPWQAIAAPPREGSVHLRRTTRLSVCRRAPLRKGSVRPAPGGPPGPRRRTRAKGEVRPKHAAKDSSSALGSVGSE